MRLLVLDANSIVNRAYYGIPPLTNKSGVPTNALLGFLNIYLKMRAELSPDAVAAAFDVHAPTFRHKQFDGYKAGRRPMPPELLAQMPLLKRLLPLMGLHVVECEGFEADDILGTLAHASAEAGGECFLATGDRDSFQLVGPHVTVRYSTIKEAVLYDVAKIEEVYGVTPRQLIEVKALMGDASDNIPGVKGIGEKTALSLIREYHSLDGVYDALEGAPLTPSVKRKLTEGREMAMLSRELAEIRTDAPIPTDPEAYRLAPVNEAELSAMLTELELHSVLDRLSLAPVAQAATAEPATLAVSETARITDEEQLFSLMKEGIADVVLDDGCLLIGGKWCLEGPVLASFLGSSIPKRAFDAKALHRFAMERGWTVTNIVFDCTLAGYLLNPTATDYSPAKLTAEYGIQLPEDTSKALAAVMPALCSVMEQRIRADGMERLLLDMELPLAEVLTAMELYGFMVDVPGIRSFGDTLTEDIRRLEKEIHTLAGREFNIGSPKQLGEILFVELGLPHGKKTKTGYSTNADVLDRLADQHPMIPLILEYRKLTKLYSTYVEGLLRAAGDDGRVHSFYRQTETRTGRISSTEPNMQNIPVRTQLGRQMRKFFVAPEGSILLDADYSQIELRVLASMAGDDAMIEAFRTGADIHTITASQVFGIPVDMISPEMRRAAKAVNFGIVYGIGAFSLSQDIGVSVAEADRYIKGYLSKYHGVAAFMDRTIAEGTSNGYVATLFARRRYLPELASSNKQVQAFGKRAAMNAPIQGTAADIIKIAMVRIYRRLKEEGLSARLILQVHDELIVEAALQDAERASAILAEEMQHAAKLAVPLVADVNSARNWYDAKG